MTSTPSHKVSDTPPKQRSLTSDNSDVTGTLRKGQEFEFWWTQQYCYAVWKFPNLFFACFVSFILLFFLFLCFPLKTFSSVLRISSHVRWNIPPNQLDLFVSLSLEWEQRVKYSPIVLYQTRETVCVPPGKPLWSLFMYKEPTSCKRTRVHSCSKLLGRADTNISALWIRPLT